MPEFGNKYSRRTYISKIHQLFLSLLFLYKIEQINFYCIEFIKNAKIYYSITENSLIKPSGYFFKILKNIYHATKRTLIINSLSIKPINKNNRKS